MLFLFPFAIDSAAAPASSRPVRQRTLPMLPAPNSARSQARPGEYALVSAISEAGPLAADLLRQAIGALTSWLAALGNQANAFFAQIATFVAFDRFARDMASFWGAVGPGFASPQWPAGFAGFCPAPARQPSLNPFFGLSSYSANPAPANPWALFAEAANMWTSFWLPTPAPKRPEPTRFAPLATTVLFPGFAWSFTPGN